MNKITQSHSLRPHWRGISVLISTLTLSALMSFQAAGFEGKSSGWNGYTKTDFTVDGRPCYVVEPKSAAPGKPWVWRATFLDYHPEVDFLLLADGYHIAFMNCDSMLGSPTALKRWEAFYREMTEKNGLHWKVVLEEVSRGGLFVYRWAGNPPDTVACIYNDVPVCEFKSWPDGKGLSKL